MRKSFVALLLLVGAAAWMTNLALASVDDGGMGQDNPKLLNGKMQSRAEQLGSSAGAPPLNDTTYVGWTPGHFNASNNWWSIYSGFGKSGYHRPGKGIGGMWDWDVPVNGDSLQGWWPQRMIFNGTGGQVRQDFIRPWWAIDIGNIANYVINENSERTNGVNGVWHIDPGLPGAQLLDPNVVPPPIKPQWSPLGGSFSAWMGLRGHGDLTVRDDKGKQNPFNEDVLTFSFTGAGSVSSSGNDKGFPGYGSQMDQMLYRDIDYTGKKGQPLRVTYKYQTNMSKGFGNVATTRTGWFDCDPLGVTGILPPCPGPDPFACATQDPASHNNFISRTLSATNSPVVAGPCDSFMVYVGAGVDTNKWLGSDGELHQVYDPKHRWFGEVLHWDRDPNTLGDPPIVTAGPQPLYYKEILSVAGDNPATTVDLTIDGSVIAPFVQKNNKIRLVFRVKTNRGATDDEGTTYTSGGKGAAVVDDVGYQIGANPPSAPGWGDFESGSTPINNEVDVSALDAWKSTGKPPAMYHHVHALSDLVYQDICGQPGATTRICNLNGIVVSAGDHDRNEAAGGLIDLTAERERFDGMYSPAIDLTDPDNNPATVNAIGLYGIGGNGGKGDIEPGEDYYLDYEIYPGVFDLFVGGNDWRGGVQSYPGKAKAANGGYPSWGQLRMWPFVLYNPDKLCQRDREGMYQFSLIATSNASGIPDSVRLNLQKRQECFRFGVSTSCASTDGCYWDNVSLTIVDGTPSQMSTNPWDWLQDAFPNNESPGLPGVASLFDTTSCDCKSGLNRAQATGDLTRQDIPGDSVVISSSSTTRRLDIVFRVLPGPGNYEPVGNGHTGTIVREPTGANRQPVTPNDGSWWDVYRRNPGEFASPGAIALMTGAKGGWDPNVWLSARCDTLETNLFALQPTVLGGPADPAAWVTYYHESDKRFGPLGYDKPRCYVIVPGGPIGDPNIICSANAADVPGYVACNGPGLPCAASGFDGNHLTKEYSKILPDRLFTPGTLVEYFFRDQKDIKDPQPLPDALMPDTNIVVNQISAGDFDGHRWKTWSCLPDRWKDPAYLHPVFQKFGHGPACMLVVDGDDRRGNEIVWVSIADTIGATSQQKWGAHNGWHAKGNGNPDNPADNIRGKDKSAGFTTENGGQPGTTWDLYNVGAAESADTGSGRLGSRLSDRSKARFGAPGDIGGRHSRQGPTPEMMDAYYSLLLYLSGDLNTTVLGPFDNMSSDDVGLITGWLTSGAGFPSNDRGFWAIGDGFVEDAFNSGPGSPQFTLIQNYMGVNLNNKSYIIAAGNPEFTPDLIPVWNICPRAPGDPYFDIYGVRNNCIWTNDVLEQSSAKLGETVVSNTYERTPGGPPNYPAGIFKTDTPAQPWKSLVDGWDIEHITTRFDFDTKARHRYFNEVFTWLWSKICTITGTPIIPLDVPQIDNADLVNYVNLAHNPLDAGDAIIRFGLAKADRVEVKVFDVSGRLVRTLADRMFAAGPQTIRWDGTDDGGRQVARGVYFTQVRYLNSKFAAAKKLTVLK